MIHKGLTLQKWSQFSLVEQLANVGCDIDRAIRWKEQGNHDYSVKAFERALELLSLTIADPKNRGEGRRGTFKELVRTREALIDHFVYDNEYQTTDKIWHDYFFAFNYAAALRKGK
jgi:hypothetical protein